MNILNNFRKNVDWSEVWAGAKAGMYCLIPIIILFSLFVFKGIVFVAFLLVLSLILNLVFIYRIFVEDRQ